MVDHLFQSLVTGTLGAGALLFLAMVECQIRGWRDRQRAVPNLLNRRLSTTQYTVESKLYQPDTLRGYDSPEVLQRDESVRRKKQLKQEN